MTDLETSCVFLINYFPTFLKGLVMGSQQLLLIVVGVIVVGIAVVVGFHQFEQSAKSGEVDQCTQMGLQVAHDLAAKYAKGDKLGGIANRTDYNLEMGRRVLGLDSLQLQSVNPSATGIQLGFTTPKYNQTVDFQYNFTSGNMQVTP